MSEQTNDIKQILQEIKVNGNYNEKEFKELTLWIDGILNDGEAKE